MIKTLETERLVLRGLREDDFEAVHNYMSRAETGVYMPWGPDLGGETRRKYSRPLPVCLFRDNISAGITVQPNCT